MIFSKTHEDPKKIIASIKKMKIPKFSKFSSFYFVVPEKFKEAPAMILTKFDELFGPMLNARSHTFEATKHAKTLVQSKKEIFLGIGTRKPAGVANFRKFGLTPKADFGEFLSKAYYIIGKIQRENPPYFEKNLENYCRIASRLFGQKISPIVE
ncbi:hypothetical protein D6829_01695 [Candidatus Pacearchaeota archaeon]|nr:MAG: hypothetical protein D6829_01695 [Candidatus Pacearchaeota archaeon]